MGTSGMTIIQDDIVPAIDSMVDRSNSFRQIWKKHLRSAYLAYQEERFLNAGVPGKDQWDSLAPSTVRYKSRYFPSNASRILVAQEYLRPSMTGDTSKGYREVVTNTSVIISDTLTTDQYPEIGKKIVKRTKKERMEAFASKAYRKSTAYNVARLHDEGSKFMPKRRLTYYDDNFMQMLSDFVVANIRGKQ